MRQFAPWLLVLLSAALAVAAYLQALHYPFISDDISYVVTNKNLADLHLGELWRLLVKPYNVGFEFLPLRDLSYWTDLALFGLNPAAFRLHNILLYLLCLPLVYATTANLWRYFRPTDNASAPWAAATVTALFAVHPALVESVVWISGRKYILPDFFSLLALWLAVNTRREPGLSSRYAMATLLAFVAVMFSKSSYVGVAPIIAVLWLRFWLDIPAPQRRRSLLLWPAAILLLAAFLLWVFIVRNEGFDSVPTSFGIEPLFRSFSILGGLIRIALSPEARHFFYPVFEDPWLPAMIVLGAIALIATGWGAVAFLCRRSFSGFVLLVFLLLCLPYLQLIPTKPPSLVSDRYIALAIWPVALLLVMLAWRLKPAPRIVLLLLVALPWCFQTLERPRDWNDFKTLVTRDWRTFPGYYVPAFYVLMDDQMHNGRYREATKTANLTKSPEIRNAMLSLIQADYLIRVVSISTGEPDKAVEALLDLGSMFEHPPARASMDTPMLFIWLKLYVMQATEWQYLAEKFPDDAYVHYNAGGYFMGVHDYKDAEIHLRAAIASQRLAESLRKNACLNLKTILLETGRPEVAAHAASQCPDHTPGKKTTP